jgi:hypothetical protein
MIVVGALLFIFGCLVSLGNIGHSYDATLTKVVTLIMVISLCLIFGGYALWNNSKKDIQKAANVTDMFEKKTNINSEMNPYYKWIFGIVIGLVITLPFHYVPSSLQVFPKDNLSLSYTIITQEDVDNLLKRYNDCESGFQQQSIRNEPLFRKLSEHGIIFDKKSNEENE